MAMTAAFVVASLMMQTASQSDSPVQSTAASSNEVAASEDITVSADKSTPNTNDRSHPDYVRCKTESVIGSRAKRKRTCMTNREWALTERRGNEASKVFAGDNFAAGYN